MLEHIHWLGHSSFRLGGPPADSGPTIYIDPWRVPRDAPPGDVFLITHDHFDHCSPEDIDALWQPHAVIVCNARAAKLLNKPAMVMQPLQMTVAGGVPIKTVPAYTLNRASHAREFGGLGFVVTMFRTEFYFAGDCDLMPEMRDIFCDVALLPVGGGTTMDYEEAAEAVELLRPRCAVPMHYGREVPGSQQAGRLFCQRVRLLGFEAVEMGVESRTTAEK